MKIIGNIQSKCTVSDYFKSLLETEERSYKVMLTLSNGFVLQDPFAVEEWPDNVKNSGINLSRHSFILKRYS